MPAQSFPIEPNGPPRVHVSWGWNFKDLVVRFDQAEVARFASKQDIKTPQSVPLPDGSNLTVHFKSSGLSTGLELTRNGVPLPGSASDPRQVLGMAYGVIYFVAGMSAVVGLIAIVAKVDLLLQMGIGWASVATGAIYAALGWAVHKKLSLAALVAAILLFTADTFLVLIAAADAGGNPGVGVVVRVFLLIAMWRGIGAIRAIKSEGRR